MIRRSFVKPLVLAFASLAAGCISGEILETNNAPTVLPALELVKYDSLAGGSIAFQRFGTSAGNFRGVYVVKGTPRTTQSMLSGRALDRTQLSPDGTTLLYGAVTSTGASIFDLFKITIADSVETRLSSGLENESYPGWASADMSTLYYSYRGNGLAVIVRRSVSPTGLVRDTVKMTDSVAYQWNIDSPISVHPTSGRLLMVVRSAGWAIWAMDANGANRVLLKRDTRADFGPVYQGAAWSPDGLKIAFMELNYDGIGQMVSTSLKIMNADGTGEGINTTIATLPFQFQNTSLNDFSLCWLGATRIAMSALGADRASHIWIARTGPVTLTQLTTNSGVFDRGVSCKP